MLAHPAVWAIVVNNFTFHYAFYVVMNWLPTYFDKARGAAAGACWAAWSAHTAAGCLHAPLLAGIRLAWVCCALHPAAGASP
jgi:cyanate permease